MLYIYLWKKYTIRISVKGLTVIKTVPSIAFKGVCIIKVTTAKDLYPFAKKKTTFIVL
jgi:hypothetical protein